MILLISSWIIKSHSFNLFNRIFQKYLIFSNLIALSGLFSLFKTVFSNAWYKWDFTLFGRYRYSFALGNHAWGRKLKKVISVNFYSQHSAVSYRHTVRTQTTSSCFLHVIYLLLTSNMLWIGIVTMPQNIEKHWALEICIFWLRTLKSVMYWSVLEMENNYIIMFFVACKFKVLKHDYMYN